MDAAKTADRRFKLRGRKLADIAHLIVNEIILPALFEESISILKISFRRIRKKDMGPFRANIFGGNDSSGNTGRSVNFLDFYRIND
jgi:hypothetical protein